MLLDVFKLVVLCAKHVDIGYDSRVSKVVKSVVDNKMRSAARVENGVVSIFDTWMVEVGGGVGSCMKAGAVNGLVFAFCPLVDNTVID